MDRPYRPTIGAHLTPPCFPDIAGVVALSFQRIALPRAAAYLHLEAKAPATQHYLEALGATLEGEVVVLPATEDNTSKPQIIQANIRFERTYHPDPFTSPSPPPGAFTHPHAHWHVHLTLRWVISLELSKIIGGAAR